MTMSFSRTIHINCFSPYKCETPYSFSSGRFVRYGILTLKTQTRKFQNLTENFSHNFSKFSRGASKIFRANGPLRNFPCNSKSIFAYEKAKIAPLTFSRTHERKMKNFRFSENATVYPTVCYRFATVAFRFFVCVLRRTTQSRFHKSHARECASFLFFTHYYSFFSLKKNKRKERKCTLLYYNATDNIKSVDELYSV